MAESQQFRYGYDVQSAMEPWRARLGDEYENVIARLSDRDRQLEDYLKSLTARLDALDNGSALSGQWTSFTPVMSWLVNATIVAEYTKVGRLVVANYRVDVSGAVTAANLLIDLPFTARRGDSIMGVCYHSGLTFQNPAVCRTGGGATSFFVQDNTTFINNTHVGAGDFLTMHICYEATT